MSYLSLATSNIWMIVRAGGRGGAVRLRVLLAGLVAECTGSRIKKPPDPGCGGTLGTTESSIMLISAKGGSNVALFTHILIPFNGTRESKRSFKKAVEIAGIHEAKVTILTCIEERQTFGFFRTKTNKKEFEDEKRLVAAEHDDLSGFASKHGIRADSKIVKSSLASSSIVDFAAAHGVDLIVMGRRRFSTVAQAKHHWSTLDNVFNNAPVPLLVFQ